MAPTVRFKCGTNWRLWQIKYGMVREYLKEANVNAQFVKSGKLQSHIVTFPPLYLQSTLFLALLLERWVRMEIVR